MSDLTQQRPRRILVVEDDRDALEALQDLCELWGHQVATASNGTEGLRLALSSPPEIAIVDVGLPGIDGFELARRLRADPRGQDVFLIALTGHSSPQERQQSLAAGFNRHVVKPVEMDALEALLVGAP